MATARGLLRQLNVAEGVAAQVPPGAVPVGDFEAIALWNLEQTRRELAKQRYRESGEGEGSA